MIPSAQHHIIPTRRRRRSANYCKLRTRSTSSSREVVRLHSALPFFLCAYLVSGFFAAILGPTVPHLRPRSRDFIQAQCSESALFAVLHLVPYISSPVSYCTSQFESIPLNATSAHQIVRRTFSSGLFRSCSMGRLFRYSYRSHHLFFWILVSVTEIIGWRGCVPRTLSKPSLRRIFFSMMRCGHRPLSCRVNPRTTVKLYPASDITVLTAMGAQRILGGIPGPSRK